MKLFTFIWRWVMAIGLYMVFREIYYVSDLLSAYVNMLLKTGTF